MSESDAPKPATDAARAVAELLAVADRDGRGAALEGLIEGLEPEQLQAALTLLGKTFVEWYQRGEAFMPVSEEITATDAFMLCHGILDAADLEVFELGMWHSFKVGSDS